MEQLSSDAIRMMSPLGLAYIGDGIYELLTREHIVSRGNMPVAKFHKETVSLVCAAAQSEAGDVLLAMLDVEETAV